MARHMEWSEERSPQWQYLLSRDRFAKRKKEVQEEPTARRRTKVEKRKYKKTLKNGKTVTVFWSSETEQQKEQREEENADS